MFDEKSRSSLEKVSLQEENSKAEDLLHLMKVLNQSKETLKEVQLKVANPREIQKQVIELLAAGSKSKLRRLVIWDWPSQFDRNKFPLSRLAPSTKVQTSSVGQLQLLWLGVGVGKLDSKHLNSLISFAQARTIEPSECRKLISSFSKTLVHLRLGICQDGSPLEPLFCPNLKVFEGWVLNGVPSFFDAPQLKTIVMERVEKSDFQLPPSVEEIWLRSRSEDLDLAEEWQPLLRHCPKLRILKLMEEFVLKNSSFGTFVFTGVLEILEIRSKMAQDGEEIDGIKIVSLQKLILPTSKLNEEELNRAAEVADEMIDVKDHPEFIEATH